MPTDVSTSLVKSNERTHEEKREKDSVDRLFIIFAVDEFTGRCIILGYFCLSGMLRRRRGCLFSTPVLAILRAFLVVGSLHVRCTRMQGRH